MSSFRLLVPAALLLAAATGCGSTARLVNGTPDGGVVAIPSNSNYWPMKYRDDADKMMAQRCPNGYEIVSEGEVVVGQTATTNENVDHRTPTNSNSRYRVDQTTTQMTTTTSDKTEYRITFRAKPAAGTPTNAAIVPTSAVVPSNEGGLPPRPVPVGQ
jgi:hypothetical protein